MRISFLVYECAYGLNWRKKKKLLNKTRGVDGDITSRRKVDNVSHLLALAAKSFN